ncbi:hypothetical protein AB2M62_09015 [Sphingomonas sp. MMS12-HWE2-04]|uniref:hypothetical protein n=1 Tax=Sphingomonas sp. MMS12-HWE2-04 TaxID=3234199 RepID=UPI00384BEC48
MGSLDAKRAMRESGAEALRPLPAGPAQELARRKLRVTINNKRIERGEQTLNIAADALSRASEVSPLFDISDQARRNRDFCDVPRQAPMRQGVSQATAQNGVSSQVCQPTAR